MRNIPKKRFPAIVDRAVWEKGTKGRAGIMWDSVVEKIWKDIGGNPEYLMSAGRFGRYKAEAEERIEIRERPALRNKVESKKKTLGDIRGIERRNRKENVFARPNGLRENAETAISCR